MSHFLRKRLLHLCQYTQPSEPRFKIIYSKCNLPVISPHPSTIFPIFIDPEFKLGNTNKHLDHLLVVGKFRLLHLALSSCCPPLVHIQHLLYPASMDSWPAYQIYHFWKFSIAKYGVLHNPTLFEDLCLDMSCVSHLLSQLYKLQAPGKVLFHHIYVSGRKTCT